MANRRTQQRDETRGRILEAAVEAFSDRGFRGASTRDIADRAGVNQGLVTYHFKSKELMWRAAADHIFGELRAHFRALGLRAGDGSMTGMTQEVTKVLVRFSAERPELCRFMIQEGKHENDRMQWLVDTHIKPMYEEFAAFAGVPTELIPHAFYALVGAASVIFAVAPECRRLTGLDPTSDAAIEVHADFVARMLLPEANRPT